MTKLLKIGIDWIMQCKERRVKLYQWVFLWKCSHFHGGTIWLDFVVARNRECTTRQQNQNLDLCLKREAVWMQPFILQNN